MTASEQTGLEEKAHAERVIEAFPKLPEIDGFHIRLDDDWTGDPSLYVTFHLKVGTEMDLSFLERFNQYRLGITSAILSADMTRFPYTSFQKAA